MLRYADEALDALIPKPNLQGCGSLGPEGLAAGRAIATLAATPPVRVIAIDGKSARGVRPGQRVVLGQTVVDGKTNKINAFAPLADLIDITDAIIIADALHTQHRHADYFTGRSAHYV